MPEIKSLVVDDKWLAMLYATVSAEVERVSQSLTQRVRELAMRYENPLPVLLDDVTTISERVNGHLLRMGVTWK